MVFGRQWARLGPVAALCVAAVSSEGAEPFPVCGSTTDPTEGGCWQPLEGQRRCHVWNPNPQPEESADFEGRSRCRDGKLSGIGTLTWRWTEDGEIRSSTFTGPYAEGRANGRFVQARPDGYRAEGEYVDGKPHGNWVNSYPPGTEGKWDRIEASWVDGVSQGNWVYTDYEEVDGEFRETGREEGPVANGERHGDWDIVQRTFNSYSVSWSHRHGPYAEGERQRRWVELSHRANRDQYDARGAEAARWIEQEEGPYVDGKQHGNWVIVLEWTRDWDEVLAEAEAKRSIRRQGAYAEGQRHGTWKASLSNGQQIVRNYAQGTLHGPYEARDADGSVLVAAGLEDGKVTEIRLPKAALPSIQDGGSAQSPVVGGFGISLGPDMEQLRQLKCGDGSCITSAFWALNSVLEGFGESDAISGWVDEVPKPITRGRQYDFSVSPWIGISEVKARLHFESVEACKREKVRIDGLLRDKYGECRDYRHRADTESRKPIGQCDADGLPVAVVETWCTIWYSGDGEWDALILSYGVLDPGAREAVLEASRDKGEVHASEL